MDEDIPVIIDTIDTATDLAHVNEQLREACIEYLAQQGSQVPDVPNIGGGQNRSKATRPTMQKKKPTELSRNTPAIGFDRYNSGLNALAIANGRHVPDDLVTADGDILKVCPHCDKPCDDYAGSIMCDTCELWAHLRCEGLTEDQGQAVGDTTDEYLCLVCKGKTSIREEQQLIDRYCPTEGTANRMAKSPNNEAEQTDPKTILQPLTSNGTVRRPNAQNMQLLAISQTTNKRTDVLDEMGRGLETDRAKTPLRPSLVGPTSPNNTQVLSHHEDNINSSSTVRESKKTKGRKATQTNQRNTDPQILGTADTGKPPELKEKISSPGKKI